MQSLVFLAAVLPSSGVYCVAEITTKKKEHVFVTNLEDLVATAQRFDVAVQDAYFALSTFEKAGSRLAKDARFVKSLYIDLDCGKKPDGKPKDYPDKKTAFDALTKFLADTELDVLGNPWVVDSGGGLHAYWPFEKEVTVAEWLPLAESFKRLCHRHGFKIDSTCTSDAARVMRVPGTNNYKPEYGAPKPVKVKVEGDTFSFAELKTVVGVVEPEPTLTLPGNKPKALDNPTAIKLFENSSVLFADIRDITFGQNRGCLQLAHYVDHAHEDGMEPLWRGLLSIAKVCDDGEEQAEKLSKLHPYSMERMRTKLKEIKGPYPCAKFDSENPGVCPGCQHWGKITNPLAIARKTLGETEEKVIEVAATQEDEPPAKYTRPEAPRGFLYGKHGGVYREKEDEDDGGTPVKTQLMILPYDLFVVDILHVENVHSVHMVALRADGPKDIIVPTKALVSKDETVKALAEQNIMASFGAGNDKNLFDYVRGATEAASLKAAATNIPTQYGWQADQSFVLSGRIFFKDGTSRATPMPGLENIAAATKPAGTLDGWKAVVNLLIRKRLYEILAHGCIGFGSPLMCFTGMRGLTFHAGHKESGTGKSLALSIAASVWGHPVDYRTGKSTSPVAMQQRAGNLNSLPFLSDELTMRSRGDAEWFPAFVFDFSEGRGKERMEARMNRERVNTTTWSSLALFTSNTRMLDYMTGVRQHSSEGELRRFLEWSPSKRLEFNHAEQRVVTSLQKNYGLVGELYARWLVENRDKAKTVVEQVRENLFTDFGATNDERFWIAGVAAVVAGAVLVGRNYAGLIDLPVQAITDVFRGMVDNAREAIKGSAVTCSDILNDYIREYYGQFVIIRRPDGIGSKILGELANGGKIDSSLTRSKVLGRVEHDNSPGWVDFYIEEGLLKRHCAIFGYGFSDFKNELAKRFKVAYVSKDMLSNTRGPTMRVNAVHISMEMEDAKGLAEEKG